MAANIVGSPIGSKGFGLSDGRGRWDGVDDRVQQLAAAGPENLNAKAKQDKGRKPHDDVGTSRPEQALHAIRIGETHEYGDRDHHDGREAGKKRKDLVRPKP